MANFLSGFLDNLTQGLGNPKGTLGDFAHAARLYNSNAFRLAPKVKFLYHVVFNLNPAASRATMFDTQKQGTAINMLVKQVDLPKYKIQVDNPHQYNRKKQVHTKLEYEPIVVTFHDDNVGLTTSLWNMYYNYYFADSKNRNAYEYSQNAFRSSSENKYRYGLDNNINGAFFSSIQIFQLERHMYHSFTLLNPIITAWSHDTLNNEASETVQSTMSVAYESVLYGMGAISEDTPVGFATEYYDKMPSPLLPLGGGTTSVFGQGGVVNGITDILGSVLSGQAFSNPSALFGTIIKGTNVLKNANRITKAGRVEENANLIKKALGNLTGIDVTGVSNVYFPKTQVSTVVDITIANPPVETYPKNVQDASLTFATKFKNDSIGYANAVTLIVRNANIAGIPNNVFDFNKLNKEQKDAAVAKIMNEYDSGNTKVVALVNKIVKLGS
jgi:hypothetical protein